MPGDTVRLSRGDGSAGPSSNGTDELPPAASRAPCRFARQPPSKRNTRSLTSTASWYRRATSSGRSPAPSDAFGSAPARIKARAASTLPKLAASCNGVLPSVAATLGSPPAASSSSTADAFARPAQCEVPSNQSRPGHGRPPLPRSIAWPRSHGWHRRTHRTRQPTPLRGPQYPAGLVVSRRPISPFRDDRKLTLRGGAEGGVGPLDEAVVGASGAADTDGDGDRRAALGQDHDELLAAPTIDHVLDPGGGCESPGHLAEDGIAGAMASPA